MTNKKEQERQFAMLNSRLQGIWANLQTDADYEHTSLIVPSLSVNQEELAKVLGAAYYEERLLFALIRLRNPNARLIYVTSHPVHPDIVDYYLQLLDGVTVTHARQRLQMLSVHDMSSRPLSEKILERPRFLKQLRQQLGDLDRAYLTCYNSTVLEKRLALELDIPLNGVNPELLYFGTKSGSRAVFAATGVAAPLGTEDLHSEDEIISALQQLATDRPGLRRAIVKLNEGFAGEGNGIFTFPEDRSDDAAIITALRQLKWSSSTETFESFLRKFSEMGGIVEEMIEADTIRSPSVQLRTTPDGHCLLVSSHEQILGGSTGSAYLGCRFPANDDYRLALHTEAEKIGRELSSKGVIGRFSIDFLVTRSGEADWNIYAIEINLRMSGTTPPFHALEFLTGGSMDPASGRFRAPGGQEKFYRATDNLKSPMYRGLLPHDLFQIMNRTGLSYRHATGTGVLFYMVGALSQYGKVGMTCIGNTREEAEKLFERTIAVLDNEAEGDAHGELAPIFDRYLPME